LIRLLADVGDYDAGAGSRKCQCGCPANPAATSGDECHLPFEVKYIVHR
jgi:hypothetical protein